MIALTYYEHIDKADSADEWELVKRWGKRWAAMGWNAIVVDANARSSLPDMRAAMEQVAALAPTMNNRRYETACWMRWVAFAERIPGHANERVLCADYDVFNRGFRPEDAMELQLEDGRFPAWNLCHTASGGPILFVGGDTLRTWVWLMIAEARRLTQAEEASHVSDMVCMQELVKRGVVNHIRLSSLDLDDQGAVMVHLCNRAVHESGQTKLDVWDRLAGVCQPERGA